MIRSSALFSFWSYGWIPVSCRHWDWFLSGCRAVLCLLGTRSLQILGTILEMSDQLT